MGEGRIGPAWGMELVVASIAGSYAPLEVRQPNPNTQWRLEYPHCRAWGFNQGKRMNSLEETMMAAVAPIGCSSSHFGTTAPPDTR